MTTLKSKHVALLEAMTGLGIDKESFTDFLKEAVEAEQSVAPLAGSDIRRERRIIEAKLVLLILENSLSTI